MPSIRTSMWICVLVVASLFVMLFASGPIWSQDTEGGQNLCDLATTRIWACVDLLCAQDPEGHRCGDRDGAILPFPDDAPCDEVMMNMASVMLDLSCADLLGEPAAPDDPETRIPLADQPIIEHQPPATPSDEVNMNLGRIFDWSASYYDSDHVTATGSIVAPQFPESIGLTPSEVPCGTTYQSSDEDWDQPTWQALNFAFPDPQYYSYQYDSTGTGVGATFTASAFGDLDCDSVLSTFMWIGEVIGGSDVRGGGLIVDQPDE